MKREGGRVPVPIALAILGAVFLTGCGRQAASSAGVESSGGTLVIEVHNYLNNPAFVRAIEEISTLREYESMDFQIAGLDEEYETTLPIKIAAGLQVDIIAIFNPIQLVKFADAGVIIPLDGFAEASGVDYRKEFGSFAAAAVYRGRHYTLPQNTTQWALFYNKAIFDRAGIAYPDPAVPMTWKEYRQLAARLTSGAGDGKIYGALHLYWPMFWYGEAIMELGGGEHFYTPDGRSNIGHPAFKRALQAAYRMQHRDKSIPPHADLVRNKTPPQAFFDGRYGMFVQGPWLLNWAMDRQAYPRDWELGIAPLPVDSGTVPKTWGVVGGLAVPPTSGDPQRAFDTAMDILRFSAKYAATEPAALRTVPQTNLFIEAGEMLGGEGLTTEVIKEYFLSPGKIFLTEKVTGPYNARYEQVINEEVEKYFVREQDLETTIAQIKKRGDRVIAGE